MEQFPKPYTENELKQAILDGSFNTKLSYLLPVERDILRLHLGLDDGRKRTFSEISELLGISIKETSHHYIITAAKLRNKKNNIPLNQILYGPPGTGKTYNTKHFFNNILNPCSIQKQTLTPEISINELIKHLNWYTAIAVSMYYAGKDNCYTAVDIENQKIMASFINTTKNSNINREIWKQMQTHTTPNSNIVKYAKRQQPYLFDKKDNSEWYLTEEGKKYVEEHFQEYFKVDTKETNTEITAEQEICCSFITFHQSYSYEEFIEGIKPSYDSSNNNIKYCLEDGIFKSICLKANANPNKKYIIVIDEINRGNISKIFGELITLIEDDKRVTPNGESDFENTLQENNELLVTLPYSKTKFGVPNNLYILGTMNTSDRSIASIDIALRRRFKFVEMMPNSSLVSDFGCNFSNIFKILNQKISILLDRDHQIGHSYFINTKFDTAGVEKLKEIWFDSIMPLLNEYFYGDWEKLKLVIPGFIKSNQIPECLKNECDEDVYYEFKAKDDFNNDQIFVKALNQESFVKEDRQ